MNVRYWSLLFNFEILMSVPLASTPVTPLVSVRTMLDLSLVTAREDIQATECGVQVKLLSFLVLFFSFRLRRCSTICWESKSFLFHAIFHLQHLIIHLTVSSVSIE